MLSWGRETIHPSPVEQGPNSNVRGLEGLGEVHILMAEHSSTYTTEIKHANSVGIMEDGNS